MSAHMRGIYHCHCEGVRSTLKTLAYDCGNPVQYVCGHLPAVLFYLLDRHALLAMTMGSKCVFLNSLTTPGCAHPSNGGKLVPRQEVPAMPAGWSLCPTPSCFACPPPKAVSITCTLHSNKKRGGAPFF